MMTNQSIDLLEVDNRCKSFEEEDPDNAKDYGHSCCLLH